MNTEPTPTPELVALLELSERATPGAWEVSNGTDLFTELGGTSRDGLEAAHNDGWQVADFAVGVTFVDGEELTLSCAEQKSNADFIAALVNWFRSTRPAAQPQGVSVGALDAARYRWLLNHAERIEWALAGDSETKTWNSEAEVIGEPDDSLSAAIDAAMTPPPAEASKGDGL